MGEADIQSLLNINSDFNLDFSLDDIDLIVPNEQGSGENATSEAATAENVTEATTDMTERERIHEFIDNQKKINTVRSTKRDLKIFYEFAVKKGEMRNIEHIPASELDLLLSAFYIEIRKRDGTQYEPISLTSVKSSIERHLKDHDCEYSLHDKTFSLSNRTLAAKKVELRKEGKGEKPNAAPSVSCSEENLLWERGQLGDSTPKILSFSLWYYFTKCFGMRSRHAHRQLKYGDIELKKGATSDREYLEFARERVTKTRDGTGKENNRKVKPRLYATDSDRDPVKLYKKYIEKREDASKTPDFPFYLTCIPVNRLDSDIWYYSRPMGKNTIGQLMPVAAKECGLGRKTNHSVCKSCVQSLRKAGVARD